MIILSLFDESGEWSHPYQEAGYDVYRFDLKDGYDVNDFCVEYLMEDLGIDLVTGILAAPPCTDFTNSGSWKWSEKDANGTTQFAMELVMQVMRTVEFYQPDFYAIENPVGRMKRLILDNYGVDMGEAWYFQPHEFAQLADIENNEWQMTQEPLKSFVDRFTPEQRQGFVEERYTKKTGIWGEFNKPAECGMDPIRYCDQGSWLQRLGGKSERTKEIRSKTPSGFARAFFNANNPLEMSA